MTTGTTEKGFENLIACALTGLPLGSGPATMYVRTSRSPESRHPDMKQRMTAQRAKRRIPSSDKGFYLDGIAEETGIRTSSGQWRERFEERE